MSVNISPRSSLVLSFVWGCLAAIGFFAASGMHTRITQGMPLEPPDPALARLQPLLAGETMEIPSAPGLWWLERQNTTGIASIAERYGQAQRINLCHQRTLSPHDPARLFPVIVGGDWQDLRNGHFIRAGMRSTLLRNPVVVPADVRAGMPFAAIAGRAPPAVGMDGLELSVSGNGRWRALTDMGKRADSTPITLPLRREAWMLWQHPSMPSAGAKSSADRFDHALRFRLVETTDCPSGVLEVELFKAAAQGPREMVAVHFFAKEGGVVTARFPSGSRQDIPRAPLKTVEDQRLFEQAIHHGLLRPTGDGRIAVAPADLPTAQTLGQPVQEWSHVDTNNPDIRRLLKRLHAKPDGRYVRQQIANHNSTQRWAAIRLRSLQPLADRHLVTGMHGWTAEVDGLSVPLREGMPDIAARLFDAPPAGWGTWHRVADWPETATPTSHVKLRLSMPSGVAQALPEFELLSLGRIVAIAGASAEPPLPACRGPACQAADMLQHWHIKPHQGSQSIEIDLQPDMRFSALAANAGDAGNIRWSDGKPIWQAMRKPAASQTTETDIRITARDGTPLFDSDRPTPITLETGLAPLIGVALTHDSSLAGMLRRLPGGRATARVSIDMNWQRIAHAVLDCVALHEGRWLSAESRCTSPVESVPAARQAGVVLIDADTGALLAAAGAPGIPEGATGADLIGFDRYHPAASPLRVHAWQHDGGLSRTAGSVFKLVTALGLEQAAQTSPVLATLLAGTSSDRIDAIAAAGGASFRMKGSCYPLPCGSRTPTITNFRSHRPFDHADNGRFGLQQALADSLNTWFAWLAESSDATLDGRRGYPDAHPLGETALDAARPVFAVAHALGFEQALRLDGGLLPDDFSWRTADVLQTTPSRFDPIDHRHGVRQHAIGLRMQVTPLQMARVAAAIGSGRIVKPYLLAELNDRPAPLAPAASLSIPLDRIRAGMKGAIETGTARTAFSGEHLHALRASLYAKTGTAPMPDGKHNTAWFVGYLDPHAIPGHSGRVAFACFVTHTGATGGAHAAPVMAALFETLSRPAVEPLQ